MLKDPGSRYNLGYGTPYQDQNAIEGVSPESSFIAKALHDHPVMRFLAVSATTLVGMHVAGSVVKKGGIKLAAKTQAVAFSETSKHAAKAKHLIEDYRQVQSYIDQWQGVYRKYADPNDPLKLYVQKEGKLIGDSAQRTRSWEFSYEELNKARKEGIDQVPIAWGWRDEIQTRLVAQARRLPYELPAAYLTQRAVTDPVFGPNDPNEKRVNWANPIDVLGDFANQSLKNTIGLIMPFEAGGAAASHGYKTLMMSGQRSLAANAPRGARELQTGVLTMQVLLKQVGADVGDVLNKAVRVSQQTTGAMAQGIHEATYNNVSFRDWWRQSSIHGVENKESFSRQLWNVAKTNAKNKEARARTLDMMPGPFKGMGSAARKIIGDSKADDVMQRGTFRRIGIAYDDFQDLAAGRTNLAAIKNAGPGRSENLNEYLQGSGSSTLEDLGSQLYKWGRGGPSSKDWRSGDFYQQHKTKAFNDLIFQGLRRVGVEEDAARKFVRSTQITLPRSSAEAGDGLVGRVSIGNKPLKARNDLEWMADFRKSLGIFDKKHADVISSNIQKVVTQADEEIGSSTFTRMLNNKAEKQWKTIHDQIIPQSSNQIFAQSKLPYEDFSGQLTNAKRSFLVRRSAAQMGIDVKGQADASLANLIKQRGINADDPHMLKGYLMMNKVIAKPWTTKGANIFGFKPLTFKEAFERDYFAGTSPNIQNEISNIYNSISANDPVSKSIGSLRLKGVYKTANGNVVDFARIKRQFIRGMDITADETQIPLLHFSPLNLMGYQTFKNWRQSSVLQMARGDIHQPGMDASAAGNDFNIWLRQAGRGSKGRTFGIRGGGGYGEDVKLASYEGTFRPFDTSSATLLGKHVRLAIGDQGYAADRTATTGWRGKLNRVATRTNANPDRSDSLFNLLSRWRQGRVKNNLSNPINAALKFANDIDLDDIIPEQVEGYRSIKSSVRGAGFPHRAIRELETSGDRNLFRTGLRDIPRISDVPDVALPGVAQRIMDRDAVARRVMGEEQSDIINRAGRNLSNLVNDSHGTSGFWDAPVPRSMRAGGVHRRIDQLRMETLKYLSVRNEVASGSGQSFDAVVPDLLSRIDVLRSAGKISRSEISEARAAVLGMQMEYTSAKLFSVTQTPFQRDAAVLKSLLSGPNAEANKTIFGEIGAAGGGVRGLARKQFRTTPYEMNGIEYNPFGGRTAFMPTFGTAFNRDAKAAVGSVLGINTWSNPKVFSGSSVISSHFFERLNRYFGTFDLGVDPTAYKGPLDFYARGLVASRVLPIVALGTAGVAADRTLGGYMNDRDINGNRVYSPYFIGQGADVVANAQIAMAGLVPGGQTAEEKEYELREGEVPIRQGRYWPLGNTPFKGGRIQYFRPSWYQRLKAGAEYTPEMNQTPMERLAFGYDFSPLRPLDPYRFERENFNTRPYPVSGDYFTGPWGPVTGVLNATVGRVLKPRVRMHQDEMQFAMQQYLPVGEGGAYLSTAGVLTNPSSIATNAVQEQWGNSYSAAAGTPGIGSGGFYDRLGITSGRGSGSSIARMQAQAYGDSLSAAANSPSISYGVPDIPGRLPARIHSAQEPITPSGLGTSIGRAGYQTQEMLGIYGFSFASAREFAGLGNRDLAPSAPVLQPASQGYSSSRSFWGMNLGGLGDLPLPIEGSFANLEISEIVRRFVPKEPAGIDYLNPLPNDMGRMYPWLPGLNYSINPIKTGDPYNMPDAGIRLPGSGYDRTKRIFSDQYGKYGIANMHDILGDVAPWSEEYKAIDKIAGSGTMLSNDAQNRVLQTRAQVDAMRMRHEFTPYKYKGQDPLSTAMNPAEFAVGRAWEWASHRDTFFNTKFLPVRTAAEDWERENVYGATFPQWQTPVESYIQPMLNKTAERNPILSALGLGAIGSMFGATPHSKAVGGAIGATVGLTAGTVHNIAEAITGNRFIPATRRKELALEEYADILSYTRAVTLSTRASQAGNAEAAAHFAQQAKQTMYGADLSSMTPAQLAMAVPKRKREHFSAMMYAPESEQEQILSTAGRLERRLLQAAWGKPVEQRPDLVDYFSKHELPGADSEVWNPSLNMDTIKIKMGQSLGLDMAQMGYFPQQVKEANLINPVYPEFNRSSSRQNVEAQLRMLIFKNGLNGDVRTLHNPFGDTRLEYSAGVR